MISVPPRGLGRDATAGDSAPTAEPGRKTWKRVPPPALGSTRRKPWCCLTMPKTVARPRPVPFPGSFVVKNGSKMWGMTSAEMPSPLSVTLSQT